MDAASKFPEGRIMTSDDDLTEMYRPDQRPVRDGVFLVSILGYDRVAFYSLWKFGEWHVVKWCPDEAVKMVGKSHCCYVEMAGWQGLKRPSK